MTTRQFEAFEQLLKEIKELLKGIIENQ